jgi:hypothetical protein
VPWGLPLGAGGQGWPSLDGGLRGGGATYPFHLYKAPLASPPWIIHPSLQSSPLWLGSLVSSCALELEETQHRTLSRCWISGPSPPSAASMDQSLNDVYTPYVCNASEVLHLRHLSLSTCMTTRPRGQLRLSFPTMFMREHSCSLGIQRYEHHRCSVTLQLHRINHGLRVYRKKLFFALNPNRFVSNRPSRSSSHNKYTSK